MRRNVLLVGLLLAAGVGCDGIDSADLGAGSHSPGGKGDDPSSACGNGVLDPGEDCDDGNALNLDGCDRTCGFEQSQRIAARGEGPGHAHQLFRNEWTGEQGLATGHLQVAQTAAAKLLLAGQFGQPGW